MPTDWKQASEGELGAAWGGHCAVTWLTKEPVVFGKFLSSPSLLLFLEHKGLD